MPRKKVYKDNPKRSEVKKYQDTMMADMGLMSLDELPKEERRRWEKAMLPSKSVRKKLKEMGYDLTSNNNKRSLGSSFIPGRVIKKLQSLRLSLSRQNLSFESELVNNLIKTSSIPGVDSPSEEIEIEGVLDAIDYLSSNPGLVLHLDNPMGSKKWTINNVKPPLPFHYGEVIDINNPSDGMGWDVVLAPEANSLSKESENGASYIPQNHNLLPVGYIPINDDKETWRKNTSNGKEPEGKLPPIGNDKIIMAPNGEIKDLDKLLIILFFKEIWNFNEIVWL